MSDHVTLSANEAQSVRNELDYQLREVLARAALVVVTRPAVAQETLGELLSRAEAIRVVLGELGWPPQAPVGRVVVKVSNTLQQALAEPRRRDREIQLVTFQDGEALNVKWTKDVTGDPTR